MRSGKVGICTLSSRFEGNIHVCVDGSIKCNQESVKDRSKDIRLEPLDTNYV